MAQKVDMAPDKEGSFPELPANKTLPTASTDTQLDYAFYSLRKGVQARVTDQKLECANIRALGDKENTEFSLRAHIHLGDNVVFFEVPTTRSATGHRLGCTRMLQGIACVVRCR